MFPLKSAQRGVMWHFKAPLEFRFGINWQILKPSSCHLKKATTYEPQKNIFLKNSEKIKIHKPTPRWWVQNFLSRKIFKYKWLAHIFAGRKLGSETGQLRLAPLLPLAYMKIVKNQTTNHLLFSAFFISCFDSIFTQMHNLSDLGRVKPEAKFIP